MKTLQGHWLRMSALFSIVQSFPLYLTGLRYRLSYKSDALCQYVTLAKNVYLSPAKMARLVQNYMEKVVWIPDRQISCLSYSVQVEEQIENLVD